VREKKKKSYSCDAHARKKWRKRKRKKKNLAFFFLERRRWITVNTPVQEGGTGTRIPQKEKGKGGNVGVN